MDRSVIITDYGHEFSVVDMMRILTEINYKLSVTEQKMDHLVDRVAKIELSLNELADKRRDTDARERNRKIRTRIPFTFESERTGLNP